MAAENKTAEIKDTSSKVAWFTCILGKYKFILPENLPDIGEIILSFSETEIISVKTVKPFCGQSFEGQHFSGRKAVVEIKVRNKTLYVPADGNSMRILESCFFQLAYVVIPLHIGDTVTGISPDIGDTVTGISPDIGGTVTGISSDIGSLKAEAAIDYVSARPINRRCISLSISMLVKIIPSACGYY
jgi:hypothetical protein